MIDCIRKMGLRAKVEVPGAACQAARLRIMMGELQIAGADENGGGYGWYSTVVSSDIHPQTMYSADGKNNGANQAREGEEMSNLALPMTCSKSGVQHGGSTEADYGSAMKFSPQRWDKNGRWFVGGMNGHVDVVVAGHVGG
jgi:hypothetical protein